MAINNLKKNSQGYGYTYTDLAEIHNYLESQGITYYQYIEPVDGVDYIMTVPIINGKEQAPRRGCRVVEATLSGGKINPVQAYGSSLTYSRRYSLLMAMGYATTDDDAACMTVTKPSKNEQANEQIDEKKTLEQQLKKAMAKKGVPEETICNMAGVRKISEMHAPHIKNAIKYVESL